MNKFKRFALDFAAPVVTLALPVLASAALGEPGLQAPNADINSINAVGSTLCSVTNWLFYFLIIVAVIFIIVAAFKYLTAAGDAEKVKSAGHELLYAVIAIIVGILAKATPTLVVSIIGQGGLNTGC